MTTPIAQAALRAMMVNGKYVDSTTGRLAYYGPNGEPGSPNQNGIYQTGYKMPDGRMAYYQPGNMNYTDPSRNVRPQTQVPQANPAALRPNLPTAAQGATALPFDGDAALAQAQLQAQKNSFESQATSEQQRIEREHGLQKRSVEEQLPSAQRNLLEDYAGRGLAYSSGYAYDQGDQQSQFAKLLAELDQGKTEGVADLLRQRGVFNDSWSQQLQAVQAASARRLAEQAGNLNLNPQAQQPPQDFNEMLQAMFAQQQQYTPQVQPQTQPVQSAPQVQAQPNREFQYADPNRPGNTTGAPQASMVGGKYVDSVTGRLAYYGPQGQPGSPNKSGIYQIPHRMPDGRIAYYAR